MIKSRYVILYSIFYRIYKNMLQYNLETSHGNMIGNNSSDRRAYYVFDIQFVAYRGLNERICDSSKIAGRISRASAEQPANFCCQKRRQATKESLIKIKAAAFGGSERRGVISGVKQIQRLVEKGPRTTYQRNTKEQRVEKRKKKKKERRKSMNAVGDISSFSTIHRPNSVTISTRVIQPCHKLKHRVATPIDVSTSSVARSYSMLSIATEARLKHTSRKDPSQDRIDSLVQTNGRFINLLIASLILRG